MLIAIPVLYNVAHFLKTSHTFSPFPYKAAMLLRSTAKQQKKRVDHEDDISVMTSSEEESEYDLSGAEYEHSDSDIEPQQLSDEEESDSDDDTQLNWFQATKEEDLVRLFSCSSL